MVDSEAQPAIIEAARQLTAPFANVLECRLSKEPGVSLIRPDGYLACSGTHRDGMAMLASARELLQRQTTCTTA